MWVLDYQIFRGLTLIQYITSKFFFGGETVGISAEIFIEQTVKKREENSSHQNNHGSHIFFAQ